MQVSVANSEVPVKKKRIRRRMVNGVLVSKKTGDNMPRADSELIKDIGEDCQCKRFRCFEVTTNEERLQIFSSFRKLGSFQMQELYLSGLIIVEGVKQRRPKIERTEKEGKKSEHSATFFYKLKVPGTGGTFRELSVCRKAFLNIIGISRNRLRATQKMLYNQKKRLPVDLGNQKPTEDMMVPEALEAAIISQIDDYHLSETYSVRDMHRHFLKNFRINVPYNIYWLVFHAKWNIAKFQPTPTCCPTFDTFFETLNMFGLVDFGQN